MVRKSKNTKRIRQQKELVEYQKVNDRVEYEKLIDNRRDEVEEILIEKSKDFRKFNIKAKAEDIRKDKNIIKNKSLNQLKSGFINTSNKEQYIKDNRNHIKSLSINQQRNLIKLFLSKL